MRRGSAPGERDGEAAGKIAAPGPERTCRSCYCKEHVLVKTKCRGFEGWRRSAVGFTYLLERNVNVSCPF